MSNFLYLFLIISIITNAQTFGPRQVIDPEPGSIRMVRTADIDNDGDLDIAITAANIISWYENLDGQGNFAPPIAIQEGMGQSFKLALARIDDNDTVDIAVTFFDEGILAWYPNTGNGFGTIQIIAADFLAANGVAVKDLDGDGDNDVVLGISNFTGLYWFENLDGNGAFSSPIEIDASLGSARIQVIEDIDVDGDMDVVSNSTGTTVLSWYSNIDGQGTFGTQQPIGQGTGYENSFVLMDMDGDTDLDIVSESQGKIVWRENTDGVGNFSPIIDITGDKGIFALTSADLDNDNDNDILSVSINNKVSWYENMDGLGTFGPEQIIDPTLASPRTVHAADLDGDGDMDVLSAALEPVSGGARELVWYENLTILGTPTFTIPGLKVYPNPVKEVLVVESPVSIQNVSVYTVLGSKLLEVSENVNEISMANLPSGLLLVEIETEKGKVLQKVIKE
jgi:hypothetical protein